MDRLQHVGALLHEVADGGQVVGSKRLVARLCLEHAFDLFVELLNGADCDNNNERERERE